MPGKSVSFRSDLLSNALDLLRKVGLNCANTANLIAAIVSQLAAYTEEGVPMTPAVFICNSIDQLVRLSGSGEYIPLSGVLSMDDAAKKILKATAPLCGESWRVYVERSENGATCKFGVFCGTTDPSALTVEEVVMDDYKEDSPIIRIAQNAVNKVEVKASTGETIEFRFNDDADVANLNNAANVASLAAAIAGADEQLRGYVERLLSAAIRKSHGTLLAVTSDRTGDVPPELADCVKVEPPISLAERLRSHLAEGRTSGSVSKLQVATELVCGFVASDGVTVFNLAGEVIAYRCFVHGDGGAAAAGGARTRAYAVLRGLLGRGLSAAFFRSQDGRTDVQVFEGRAV